MTTLLTGDEILKAMIPTVGHIKTFTGKLVNPLHLRIEDVDIEDIAHGLSLLCRFNGHTQKHYSVAEHSVHVASRLPKHLKLEGLLHDSSEAYLVDLPKPLKILPQFKPFVDAEENVMAVIRRKFNLATVEPEEVKRQDKIMCLIEKRALMGWTPPSDKECVARFGCEIPSMSLPMCGPWNAETAILTNVPSAKETFLAAFREYSTY